MIPLQLAGLRQWLEENRSSFVRGLKHETLTIRNHRASNRDLGPTQLVGTVDDLAKLVHPAIERWEARVLQEEFGCRILCIRHGTHQIHAFETSQRFVRTAPA